MCDHTYKCVILVKSNIFFTLCQTSFLNSTKCDFNTFLIKHYYVHQNVWVLLKCRGHCLRIVLLNFTRNTATQIFNLNISPPPPPLQQKYTIIMLKSAFCPCTPVNNIDSLVEWGDRSLKDRCPVGKKVQNIFC